MATLTVQSDKPGSTSLTLVDGVTDTGYTLLADAEFGNAVWDIAYSGPRGTQGARAASSTPQNRPVILPFRVVGATKDALASKMSALYTVVDELRRFGGKITWKSNNQTYRQHLIVMGGQASVKEWGNRAEAKNRTVMVLEATCAPYLLGDPMEITDDFSSDTLANYTFDTGAAGNVAVTGGVLDAVNNLTTENRAVHTDRGYSYGDNQVTVNFNPGTTITGFKAGAIIKRTAPTTYLEVYVDDNGTNSRLRLDSVIAGVRTNLATGNLAARIANGNLYSVRARIEGDTVYREYSTAGFSPLSTPTLSGSTTLTGGDLTAFGSGVTGKSGWSWIPQQTAALMDDFKIEPYVYRNGTYPLKLTPYGAIPGDAAAVADVSITIIAGAVVPVFALIAWANRGTSTNGSATPFAILEGESGALATWASTADANYRGGNGAKVTTAGAGTASAVFAVDPSKIFPEDHTQGDLDLEVWARVELASTVVSPTLTTSIYSGATSPGATRYAAEWGSTGRSLTLPSSGTRFRFVRLGTIPAYSSSADPANWNLKVAASWAAGSTGTFGLDHLIVVAAKSRALSPTSKANGTSYPVFFPAGTVTEITKVVRSDLSTNLRNSAAASSPTPDHGVGGALIELPTGNVDLIVKLSSLVPDDPTSDATTEQLSHAATVKLSPTPRYHFLRAG